MFVQRRQAAWRALRTNKTDCIDYKQPANKATVAEDGQSDSERGGGSVKENSAIWIDRQS